jgi:aminoglycoside phosphotransferase family enzyme/predicted kinase
MLVSDLMRSLTEPAFYPHPVQAPIAVIQTHISLVFLTGDFAYKLKKPVNFGFLDFSTLEKRHHYLNQELTMNRVVAPDLYLEVLPIVQDNRELTLGGTGEIVEYALKMRQFPQEDLLINLFETGKLSDRDMVELGKVVADFHRQTQTNDYIRAFGTPERIGSAIADNYQKTTKYIGIAQTSEQFEQTKAFSDRFLASRTELFQQRQQQDKIRECHGDLHLQNICRWQGKLQLFDRIEFNEEFRFIDVLSDVAFVQMDLDARQRPDLGNIFLNTYLEQTGDWEGVQVLPLYLCRQAYVRAKVNSLLSDDPNLTPDPKKQALEKAAHYYRLAWQYAQPRSGRLILMAGLSGSGKSTLAHQLAPQLQAIHIRSDAVRKHLAQIDLTQTGGSELYTPSMSDRTYRRLLDLGILLVKQGFTVILDGKFDRQAWRSPAIEAAQAHGFSLTILHCTAPIEILRDRIRHRQGDISDATADLLALQQQQAEPFTDVEQPYVVEIDTERSPNFMS